MKIHVTTRGLRGHTFLSRALLLLLLLPPLARAAAPGAATSRALVGRPASPAAITYYAKAAGSLDDLNTYGLNPDGSGAAPGSFAAAGQTYSVSGLNRTIAADWVVSGAGTTVVLEAGASFTVSAVFNYTGPLDLAGNATLVVENLAPGVALGSLDAASTVEYAQVGTYTVPALSSPGYGHLVLRNGGKLLSAGTTAVRGNLTVSYVGQASGDLFGGALGSASVLVLGGKLTLNGVVNFSTSADDRISVVANGTAPQVFDGQFNTIRLLKLTLSPGQGGLSLADGNTDLELGNATSGGYQLATGTTFAPQSNFLSFASGSAAVITTGSSNTGTLTLSPGTSLAFNRGSAGVVGTLLLTPGATALKDLSLDVPNTGTSSNLVLGSSLTVSGTLDLTSGILTIGSNTLFLNGPVNSTKLGFLNGANSSIIIDGAGALDKLGFKGSDGIEVRNFSLNRPGQTLTLTTSLTVNEALSLVDGTLAISSVAGANDLTLAKTVTTTAGLLRGSSNSNLRIKGSGPLGTVRFSPVVGGNVLRVLQLSRPGGTLAVEGASLQVFGPTLNSGILSLGTGVALTVTGELLVSDPAVARFAVTPTSGLSFIGTGAIGSLAFVPGQDVLGSLTLNRNVVASVPTANLVTNLTVNSLTFTFGRLFVTGANKLAVLPGGTVAGGNASSFVNALSRGSATSLPLQTLALYYPLGVAVGPSTAAGRFRPLTLTVTDAVPGTAAYTAQQLEAPSPTRTLPASLVRVSQIRYFSVLPEPGATSVLQSATLSLSYDATTAAGHDGVTPAQIGLLRVAMTDPADNTKWLNAGGSGMGTGANGSITSASFPAGPLGDFALSTGVGTPVGTNPLPVELVRFDALRQPAGVRLTWATASEKNSAYFEVQRSADGREFGRVATATAQGTTTQPTVYAALDEKAPAGRLYYRLRQVDRDGTEAYSPVVTLAAAAAAELALYPNPAAERVTADVPAAEGRTYRVLNTLGQVLAQGPAAAANPAVDVRRLSAGTYFLELRSDAGPQMRRFVKE